MTQPGSSQTTSWSSLARWPDLAPDLRDELSAQAALTDPADVLRELGPRRAAAWQAVAGNDHQVAALLCDGGPAALEVIRSDPAQAAAALAERLGTHDPDVLADLVVSTLVPAAAAAVHLADDLDAARARRAVERVIAGLTDVVEVPRTPPPTLSVVVPVHQVGPWLRECVDSLLAQTFTDLEILLVDDHCTDESVQIMAEAAERDHRVRVLRPTLRGGAHARNVGVDAARGPLLAFCDGDDVVPERAYEHLVGAILEDGSDIAFGPFLKFTATSTRPVDPSWTAFHRRVHAQPLHEVPELIGHRGCWNKVFRRTTWDGIDLVFPEVVRSNDIVPMVSACLAAETVSVVPEIVYLYRDRPGTTSMTAASASEASVLSYLRQETLCARMLTARGAPSVRDFYRHVTLLSDTWGQVGRHLSGLDDRPVSPAVAERLRELVDVLGAHHLAEIATGPRATFALTMAEDPRARLAARLARRENVPHDQGAVLDLWTELLASLPDDDQGVLPGRWTFFDQTVSRRIADVLHADDLVWGGAALERLLDTVERERAARHARSKTLDFRTDGALTALVDEGPTAFARRVRRERATVVLLRDVSSDGTGLTLQGTWSAAADYRPATLAAMVRGKPVPVADLTAGPQGPAKPPTWHATIPDDALPAGQHRLVVLGTFDDGGSTTVLHHDGPHTSASSSSGRVVVEQRTSTRDVRVRLDQEPTAQSGAPSDVPAARPARGRRLTARLRRR